MLFVLLKAGAQAPQGFNYQGVARNTSGEPLANQNVSVKTSILNDSQLGTLIYSETHSVTTNQFGLFTLIIGSGAVGTGTFNAIDWSTGSKYLKVEIDPTGGSTYSLSGTTQLLSVPYALYAAKSGSGGTSSASQWVDDSFGINYTKGKVSIGENSNEAWLQVTKDATTTDRSFLRLYNTSNLQDANVGSYFMAGTGNNMAGLDITVNSKNYFPALGSGGQGIVRSEKLVLTSQASTNAADGYVAITTGGVWNPATVGTERVRVTATGNVGIGTTTPTQKLDVIGKVRISDLSLTPTAPRIIATDANGVLGYRDIADFGSGVWQANAVGINYNGGRVGLGTSSPIVPLQIEGNFTGNDRTQIILKSTNTGQDGAVGMGMQVANDVAGFQQYSTAYYPAAPNLAHITGRLQIMSTGKGLRLDAYNRAGSINFATGGDFATTSYSPVRMVISSTGNVGGG